MLSCIFVQNEHMSYDKEFIKEWIDAPERGRQWIADKCGVGVRTVGNWLTSSTVTIPSKALRIIERLIEDGATNADGSAPPPPLNLTLQLSDEQFDAYNAAAMADGMLIREWIIHLANQAAEADAKIASENERNEPPAKYVDPHGPRDTSKHKQKSHDNRDAI